MIGTRYVHAFLVQGYLPPFVLATIGTKRARLSVHIKVCLSPMVCNSTLSYFLSFLFGFKYEVLQVRFLLVYEY